MYLLPNSLLKELSAPALCCLTHLFSYPVGTIFGDLGFVCMHLNIESTFAIALHNHEYVLLCNNVSPLMIAVEPLTSIARVL
jgi:hypothetical protein